MFAFSLPSAPKNLPGLKSSLPKNAPKATHNLQPHVNASTAVFAAAIIIPLIGVMLGEGRLKRLTFAIFVAIVITETLSATVFQALKNVHGIKLTESYVNLIVFVAAIILLNLGPVTHAKTAKRWSLRVLILSIIATALLFTTTLGVLPSSLADKLVTQSTILAWLKSTRLVWIAAAAIWLVVMNVWPNRDKDDKHGKRKKH